MCQQGEAQGRACQRTTLRCIGLLGPFACHALPDFERNHQRHQQPGRQY